MIGVSVPVEATPRVGHMRPVDLKTDLAPLADLIELVFDESMDASGRAAIREMRMMSQMGVGLNILGRLNELAVGISLGYVWIVDDQLVGNVSVYPADLPAEMGSAWIIANVGVHPDYQRRGIARKLMQESLRMVQRKGGTHALLQVNYDNDPAIRLYDSLGFVKERAFTTWSRSSLASAPPMVNADVRMTRRTRSEWHAEYDLARRIRPNLRGGIGWLTPVHESEFKASWWQKIKNFFTFSSRERLIIRTDDDRDLLASLWIDHNVGATRDRLTLLADPTNYSPYADALLNNALRRYRSTGFIIEHPHDDQLTTDLLRDYRFQKKRTVWHMRWDAHTNHR